MNAKPDLPAVAESAALAQAVTPLDMLNRAVAQGLGIDVIKELMALSERWDARQGRKAFDNAIADAKAEIGPIEKNRHVGFKSKDASKAGTDYWHEDLAQIARTVDPVLSKFGLSYRFRTTSPVDQPVTVTCILSHRDGYSEENTLSAGRDTTGNKNSIQAVGSTITYLQRYTLKAALGLSASKDDDGAAAGDAVASTDAISAEQVAALQTKIVEAGADLPRLLKHFGIAKLGEMSPAQYPKALHLLQEKARAGKAAHA